MSLMTREFEIKDLCLPLSILKNDNVWQDVMLAMKYNNYSEQLDKSILIKPTKEEILESVNDSLNYYARVQRQRLANALLCVALKKREQTK